MERKRRKDSFFGLHFDFHANPEKGYPEPLGAHLEEEDIRLICREVKPDFIQIDCKGHPGYASYPSKLGNAMPEFAKDTLAVWRKVTAEEGVALYTHYSGVRDFRYVRIEHPEEAAMRLDGTYMDEDICPFRNRYRDELLVPQLLEIAEYGVDGVWVDGDCWGVKVGYHPDVIKAFEEKYGVSISENPPQKYGDPYYEEYREFHREAFRRHLKLYCDAVHEKFPNFQIASNWAYTEEMPEKVATPVDFLSGDFAPSNSVENVQFSARIIAPQNMPWDLMSWGFRAGNVHCNKTDIQLMQEASAVMMLGGAYQTYIMQRRDTSPKTSCVLNMKPVAEYCRARQPFCQGIKNIPEVTIFNSTIDHYAEIPYPFSNGTAYRSIRGLTKLLSRAGMSFDIREEHNLFDCADKIPVVFVPEYNSHFGKDDVDILSRYAENGGTLVLTGVKTLEAFKERLNLQLGEITEKARTNMSIGDRFWSCFEMPHREVSGDTVLAYASRREDDDEGRYPLAAAKKVGKGTVILIGTDIGTASDAKMTVTARKIIEKVFDYYSPIARVEGSHLCNVNVAEKDGRTLVHLFNVSGEHNNEAVDNSDEILPIYELKLRLNLEKAPKKAVWQPDGTELTIKEADGLYEIELPKLHIHSIVEIEY